MKLSASSAVSAYEQSMRCMVTSKKTHVKYYTLKRKRGFGCTAFLGNKRSGPRDMYLVSSGSQQQRNTINFICCLTLLLFINQIWLYILLDIINFVCLSFRFYINI